MRIFLKSLSAKDSFAKFNTVMALAAAMPMLLVLFGLFYDLPQGLFEKGFFLGRPYEQRTFAGFYYPAIQFFDKLFEGFRVNG